MKNIGILLGLLIWTFACDRDQRISMEVQEVVLPAALLEQLKELDESCGPMDKFKKTEEEWKSELSPEQYRVLRKKGTEFAFTGKYYLDNSEGVYCCAACGNPLFTSDTKYDSGSGWPAFWAPIELQRVKLIEDRSHGMIRTEVVCAKCESHLGHVFDDGPQPTGLRYCVNSVSLNKIPKSQ